MHRLCIVNCCPAASRGLRPLRVHLDAIERYMGHSSIAATMDVCGHLFPSDVEDLAAKRDAMWLDIHRKELPALRWGQQYRFFRDVVIAAMTRVENDGPDREAENQPGDTNGDET